jgi:hypothetical protein
LLLLLFLLLWSSPRSCKNNEFTYLLKANAHGVEVS